MQKFLCQDSKRWLRLTSQYNLLRVIFILQKGRDPRFDNLSGKLNQDFFKKSYSFLVEQKEKEIKTLEAEISKRKKKKYSAEEVEKLRAALAQDKNDLARFKQAEMVDQVKKEHKKKVKEMQEKGLKPFYMKQSKLEISLVICIGELKKKVLEKKFESLEQKGQLQKKMEEKKKRESEKIYREYKKIERNTLNKSKMGKSDF